MSEFMEALRPRRLGAEVLAQLGRERRTGELTWVDRGQQRKIFFVAGRPERAVDQTGNEIHDRERVVGLIRLFARAMSGNCIFEKLDDEQKQPSLAIDTLGETMVAITLGLSPEQLQAIWKARQDEAVVSTSVFDKFAQAVISVGGVQVKPVKAAITIKQLILGASIDAQRTWAALIALGAVKTSRPSASAEPRSEAVHPPPPPKDALIEDAKAGNPEPVHEPVVWPTDPKAKRLAMEIEQAFRVLKDKSHYEILGVSRQVTAEEIRDAYFREARIWHSDRYAGIVLDDYFVSKAEELFRAAREASEVLSDPVKRKSYDFVVERQAQGLPTDASVILEAEGLFQKGQTLVRRGNAAAAMPLLRESVAKNKGEAEFWAYLGFAIYAAQGNMGQVEAKEALNKAVQMNHKLDVAHEFLGRIAHMEGDLVEAQKELNKALELNSKNIDAQRELRLIKMRGEKTETSKKAKSGLLGTILKR